MALRVSKQGGALRFSRDPGALSGRADVPLPPLPLSVGVATAWDGTGWN
ncbi:MAG: hypothetical protein R3C16_04155 [Hyphomonadaceae bacterium]